MNVIKLNNVSYARLGMENSLQDIQLTVEQGGLVQLKGLSRTGKSTLIDFILGIREPDSGTVRIFGHSPHELKHKFSTGIVFQKLKFPSQASQLGMLIDLIESHYPGAAGRVSSILLNEFEYTITEDKKNFSGGEESLIFFAIAQASSPKLLILDEPTSNLDENNRNRIWDFLRRFSEEGNTVLFACHDKDIPIIPTKTFLLENGQLSLLSENKESHQDLEQAESNLNKHDEVGLSHWFYLLYKHVKFNILQTIHTDKKYIWLVLISSIVYAISVSFISKLVNSQDSSTLYSIASLYSLYLATAAMTSTGNIIALERQDKTLTKILKILPLPPIIYLSGKVIASFIITSLLVFAMIGTTLVYNAISSSILHSFPQLISSILSSLQELPALSIGFILGIVPYLFLGLALGYLNDQKSVQVVALICSFSLATPIFALTILEAIEVVQAIPGKLNMAELIGDNVAAHSPIYHYIQLILSFGKAPEYDQYGWLHWFWLVWFTFISLLVALWAYSRTLNKEAKA